jgi:tetratricopeptide (TPR) repeat protein
VGVAGETEFAGTERFSVLRRLGAGGMGVVYEARDTELDVHVALKLLPHIDASGLSRFKREFRTLTSIVHPNLVELFELISEGDRWFFTMEVVEGGGFIEWVRPDGLDVDRLREALHQLVRGVSAVHAAGRLHRDLKPSNVMVRPSGQVVILDFGLVTDVGGAGVPSSYAAGTVAYMAPEQWTGAPLTTASDWYAVGVMLYEALTGRPPFVGRKSEMLMAKLGDEATPPSTHAPNLPEDLEQLCIALLRRDQAERPAEAEIRRVVARDNASSASTGTMGLTATYRVPLLGREEHLECMATALRAVGAGVTTSMHVSGASGSGKSALLERFLDDLAAESDAVVLSGRCYEQESVPYKALDTIVDALATYLEDLAPGEAAALVPPNVAVLARIFPVLSRVPAIASAPRDSLLIPDQREARRLAFVALRELLAQIGRRQPLVLVIDDLQWGDVDSALLLGELLQPPGAPRLLLLLSYRSEYVDRSACLRTMRQAESVAEAERHRVELRVEPLSEYDAERLAASLLATTSAAQVRTHAAQIARESHGNPYFVGELVRYVQQTGGWTPLGDGGPRLELDDVLWSRVLRLAPEPRELLEVVAVAGQPIRLQYARQTVFAKERVQHSVGVLRGDHFVRSTGPRMADDIETYHDRVRESVVAHLDAGVLRLLHTGLANTFESAGDADPETMAVHFEGAGVPAKAGVYYAISARAAAIALAFDRAASLFRRALELQPAAGAETTRLRRELADALANAGRGAEAAPAYQAAAQGGAATGDALLDLERLAATQYCISGRIAEGRQIFRRILARVGLPMPESPVRILASLVARRTWLRVRGVGYTERRESDVDPRSLQRIDLLWSVATALSVPDALGVASMQTKGLLLALHAGEPYRLARALAFEAFLTSAAGWPTARRTAALFAKADALARHIDNPHALGMVQLTAGLIALNQTRFVEAAAHCEEAEEILRNRCTGVWWEVATARTVQTWSLFHRGHCDELRRKTVAYIGEARDRGDLFTVTNLGAVALPHISLLADDPDTATREVDEAIAEWGVEGFHLQHVEAMFSHAHIHLYRGDGAEALRGVDQLWPRLRRALQLQTQLVRIMMVDLRARCVIAAARASHDPRALLRRAERYARRLDREDTAMSRPFAAMLHAGVAGLRGDTASAAGHLRSALEAHTTLEDRLRDAILLRLLGGYVGGDEGAALAASSAAMFARERIARPEGWVAVYAAGNLS